MELEHTVAQGMWEKVGTLLKEERRWSTEELMPLNCGAGEDF